MDESLNIESSSEKPVDRDYKKKRVEEIGSTLAQIRARVKANRSCSRKEDEVSTGNSKVLSEKSELYMQVLEQDMVKAQKLEKERPKIKEAIENLIIDRENQKLVEKKIEETRAKQSAPLPEIPQEVRKRISDLEMTIHVLKESLSEKEKVLQSKTESWRILSDQLEKRNTEILERSEIMKREIDSIKTGYAKQEQFLRDELERCKTRLQDAESLLISKENEKYDFNQIASELDGLKKLHSECDTRSQEMKKSVEMEKRLALKLKAQLKNLKNEKALKKEELINAEVERLQNQIASLEEEKGNLLLQLIDFDEAKEVACKNSTRIEHLESSFMSVTEELGACKKQCNSLQKDLEMSLSRNMNQECELMDLKSIIEETNQLKIVAEMKAVELEEKLEQEGEKQQKEISNLRHYISELESKISSLKENIGRTIDESSFSFDSDSLKELLAEWKEKYALVETNVERVEKEKTRLLESIDDLKEEIRIKSESLGILQTEINEKNSNISDYMSQIVALNEINSKHLTKIEELEKLGQSQGDQQKRVGDGGKLESTPEQTQKIRKLAANLKIKNTRCKELEESIKDLNDKIIENNSRIDKLLEEKTNLEALLNGAQIGASTESKHIEELKALLEEKDSIINKLKSKTDKELLAVEEACVKRVRAESFSEIHERENTIKYLKEENLLLESKLNENLTEIHSIEEPEKKIHLEDHIHQLIEEKELLCNQLSRTSEELLSKNERIHQLEGIIETLKLEISKLKSSNSLTVQNADELTKHLTSLKEEVLGLQQSKQTLAENVTELSFLKETIHSLQSNVEKYSEIISNKEELILSYESEIKELKNRIQDSESQLEMTEEMHKMELNNGISVNERLENELRFIKKEIEELSLQLINVTNNYEFSLEELKNKDNVVRNLEQELDNFRNKYYYLESILKDSDNRFNEVESMKSNFERYKRETDEKLATFGNAEELSNNKIAELSKQLEEERGNVLKLDMELKDIKNAYNTTLDQIETLNEELKQVMSEIELRNEELIRISEERQTYLNKLSELEDTCSELQGQLHNRVVESEFLKVELDSKLKMLEEAEAEITNLQSQLDTTHLTDNQVLNRELEELKQEYEERLKGLQVEKDDLLKVLKGSIEPEVNTVIKRAELTAERTEEGVKVFTWHDQGSNPFDDLKEDEGWGWSVSEAKLEEEHQNAGATKISELKAQIDSSETEKNQLKEELKILQLKCSKLNKKVKEMKALNEIEKTKNTQTGMGDLDFALQEELRKEIDDSEEKRKQLWNEVNSLKLEKERLLKRVDTLTSANETLIEMKERQDAEVVMWRRKVDDLKTQLKTFEWSTSDFTEESKPDEALVKSNKELEEKLSFLETENEELQQIICTMKDAKIENNNLVSEFNSLKKEFDKLKTSQETQAQQNNPRNSAQINFFTSEKETFFKFPETANIKEEALQLDTIVNEKDELQKHLNSTVEQLERCQKQCFTLTSEISGLNQVINNLNYQVENLQSKLDFSYQQIEMLSKEKTSTFEELESLKNSLKTSEEEYEVCKINYIAKENDVKRLEEQLKDSNTYLVQTENLKVEMAQISDNALHLQTLVESLTAENQSLKEMYEMKLKEFESLNFVATDISGEEVKQNIELLEKEKKEVQLESYTEPKKEQEERFNDPPIFKGFFSGFDDPFVAVATKQSYAENLVPTESTAVYEEQLQKLKDQITILEQNNSDLKAKLNAKLKESNDKSNEMLQELYKKDEEIHILKEKLQNLNEEMKKIIDSHNLLEVQKNEVVSVSQMHLSRIQELENSISSNKGQENKIHSELTEKNESLKNIQLSQNMIIEEFKQKELFFQNTLLLKDEENAHLTSELSTLKQTCEKLSNEVTSLKFQVENVETQLKGIKDENENLLFEKENFRKENENIISELQQNHYSELQQYIAQLEYFKQSVHDKEISYESLVKNTEEQVQNISLLQDNLKNALDQCTDLENRTSALQNEVGMRTHENQNLSERLLYVSQEKDQLESSVKSFSEQLMELQSRFHQAQAEKEDFHNQEAERLHQVSLEMEALQGAITEKDLEIERLSKLLTDVQEKLMKAEEGRVTDELVLLRRKLDEALCTVHLRDVRIDELTREIMQLLQERDTLQLRLSQALRKYESLKRSVGAHEEQGPQLDSSSSEKLGELWTGYMKDPSVQLDRESRHSQQMQLLTKESVPEEKILPLKEEENTDYGFFNWFFGSSSAVSADQT